MLSEDISRGLFWKKKSLCGIHTVSQLATHKPDTYWDTKQFQPSSWSNGQNMDKPKLSQWLLWIWDKALKWAISLVINRASRPGMLLQIYNPSIQRSKAGGQWIQAALSHTGRFLSQKIKQKHNKNNHSILISTLNSRNMNQYSKIFIWNRTWIPNYQSSSSAISCLHSSPSTAFSVPTA